MSIIRYLRCVLQFGHSWTRSSRKPGKLTCVKCGVRKKAQWD